MKLTAADKKALDKALEEIDRWKEAVSLEMARLTPAERAARDEAGGEWLRRQTEQVRKAKRRRKGAAKKKVRAHAR